MGFFGLFWALEKIKIMLYIRIIQINSNSFFASFSILKGTLYDLTRCSIEIQSQKLLICPNFDPKKQQLSLHLVKFSRTAGMLLKHNLKSNYYWFTAGVWGYYKDITGALLGYYQGPTVVPSWGTTVVPLGSYFGTTGILLGYYSWVTSGILLEYYWRTTGLLPGYYCGLQDGLQGVKRDYWNNTGVPLGYYMGATTWYYQDTTRLLLGYYSDITGVLMEYYTSTTGAPLGYFCTGIQL